MRPINFTPGTNDPGLKFWADRGIGKTSDLHEDDTHTRLSFNENKQKFSIASKLFFKYLQIRSFITKTQNSVNRPSKFFRKDSFKPLCISWTNLKVLSDYYSCSERILRWWWCSGLNEEITVEEWHDICLQCQVQTINLRFKLLQYKWVRRTYITPELLHCIYPNTPDACVKCGIHKVSLFHCLWECTFIQDFWKEIITIVSICINEQLPLCPKLCIFGYFPSLDARRT